MTSMREQLLEFVAELRAAGLRISVAETIDAMRAVPAAGFERVRMREALAATLVKDEADRLVFDQAFTRFFGRSSSAQAGQPDRRSRGRPSSAGAPRAGAGVATHPAAEPDPKSGQAPPSPHDQASPARLSEPPSSHAQSSPDSDRDRRRGDRQDQRGEQAGVEALHQARLKAVERMPFSRYTELDYETARDTLAPLVRRFRVRLGRRLRLARRGRVDFRRTIRAAIQRGGALVDLRFRSRRPRHIDLLILADLSGSVRYAATLMLELAAGVHECFRRVRSFVFVDRLAEAGFENGHLVMTPALDLHARSDFGRVLGELWERRDELLGAATLVIVMGDGRNNRRPARADILAAIAQRCRAVYWLNPEAPERWGKGDSAINQYARHVRALVAAESLRDLEAALLHAA